MISAMRFSFDADPSPTRFVMDDLFPQSKLRDITDDLEARSFPPFPKGSQVAKASCCIVGGQGCGKTELLKWRVERAKAIYGEKNVHVIYTDDIRVALELIDDTPVQYLIIDDAMTNASSREVYKQTDIVKTYNRSRHVFEEKLHGKPGLILYDWAWQRFGELDPAFRQGDTLIFKTGIAEPSERKLIESFLGPWYTKLLWQNWDRINRGNNAAKGVSVGCIASLEKSVGVGIYRSSMSKTTVLPDMIRHEDYFKDEVEAEVILDKYRDDPVWGRRVRCYELSQSGMTQSDIATALGINQGNVSKSLKKVEELLSKK